MVSIERETTCWKKACGNLSTCIHESLYCDDGSSNSSFLNESCPIKSSNTTLFDFGIFLEALQSGVTNSNDFPQKFFYCFWWGLQNLRLVLMVCLILLLIYLVRMLCNFIFTATVFNFDIDVILVICFCSSLGQNLKTSTYVWEICFAVFISIAGLVLFSFLIGNMQVGIDY